jgi:hypothetical protein
MCFQFGDQQNIVDDNCRTEKPSPGNKPRAFLLVEYKKEGIEKIVKIYLAIYHPVVI